MFSILLGKDEDYVDKQKQHEVLKVQDRMNPKVPFISEENYNQKYSNGSLMIADSQ